MCKESLSLSHGDEGVDMKASETKALRWGLLGAGMIARVFANAIRSSRTGRVVAVASRTPGKGQALARDFGIPTAYDSYEELLRDPEIDAAYISVTHPGHAPLALLAAEAGKHLLVEKPIGLNLPEALAIFAAASEHDVFVMEAYMYRCHPQTARLVELIHEGAIGRVLMIRGVFSYHAEEDFDQRAYNQDLAGGGILDVGCYPASMVRLLAGAALGRPFAEPDSFKALGHLGPTGVDHYSAAVAGFEQDIVAELVTGVGCAVPSGVRVYGSAGTIHVDEPWVPSSPARWAREPVDFSQPIPPGRIRLHRRGSAPEELVVPVDRDLYAYEADAVAAHLAERQAPQMRWDDTLGNMALLDRWRGEIALVYEQEKKVRPTTIAGRPLRRAASTSMTYGRLGGLSKPVARLFQGADRNYSIPYTEVMFDHYFELGGNAFDTSEAYGGGACERNLGAWIATRGIRNDVVIQTKGGNAPQRTPDGIRKQLEASLERLGTDHVDIYLMHRDNPEIPAGEFVDVINEMSDKGYCRVMGVSNWALPRLLSAQAYAERNGKRFFQVLSNQFSLARIVEAWWVRDGRGDYWVTCRDPEFEAWLLETQMVLVPWASQSSGYFAHSPKDASEFDLARCWDNAINRERRRRVHGMAEEKGVSPNNIALAWVLAQPFPVFPIIGPRRPDEITDCMRTQSVALTPEERDWLSAKSPPGLA